MAEGSKGARILLVEDEGLVGMDESRLLSEAGYDVELAPDGESALAKVRESRFDLILMDLRLGEGMGGAEAARRARELGGPPVVFLSSRVEDADAIGTRDSGAYGFIVKGSGEALLLASIRMALDAAMDRRALAESEERWAGLARTAPDFIVSIGPDRKVRSINRPPEGRVEGDFIGVDLAEKVLPEDRAAFARKVEIVFRDGSSVRQILRARRADGSVGQYEAYLGPELEAGRTVSATIVLRDVTVERSLATGGTLGAREKEAELKAAMAAFDYAPVAELLDAFHGLTGAQAAILSRDNEIFVTTALSRVCEGYFGACPETRAACVESNRKAEALLSGSASPEGGGYVEYRCANGLRDIAQPILVEGVHWGTLFLGQFLYEDDEVDEAELEARARLLGWDVPDFLAAMREVPRYTRRRIAGLMAFFGSLGKIVTSLAYAAFKERLLSRHNIAATNALSESEKRYRLLAENVGDVIWTIGLDPPRFTYVSPSITALRGLTQEEALAEPIRAALSPASFEAAKAGLADLTERVARGDPTARAAVTRLIEQPCKDGSMKSIEVSTKPVFDAEGRLVEIAGVARDATARVAADAALMRALADKDRLYAELQHRVKNSLALIVSLLSLEAGSLEDDEAKAPLEAAQARVRSIGLLYERLYRTRSVEDIELGEYLAELARTVVESSSGRKGIRIEADCSRFRIATDRAVPAGLLLYELTANAVKHAFPELGGRIRLELRLEGETVLLRLEDDGSGLPPGFDLERDGKLGALLIVQLAAQLDGAVKAGPGLGGSGAGFLVSFPLEARR